MGRSRDTEVGHPVQHDEEGTPEKGRLYAFLSPTTIAGVRALVKWATVLRFVEVVFGFVVLGFSAKQLSGLNEVLDTRQVVETCDSVALEVFHNKKSTLEMAVAFAVLYTIGAIALFAIGFMIFNGTGNPTLFAKGNIGFDVTFSYLMMAVFAASAGFGESNIAGVAFVTMALCWFSLVFSYAIYLNYGVFYE